MEKNVINLSLFIVPNSGVNEKYRLDFLRDDDIFECKMLGIPLREDEDVFQVWIHCPDEGLDNCTDHGFSRNIMTKLGISKEEHRILHAPTYVPFSQFEGKQEGDVVTFKGPLPDGDTIINIKLEQLPYRYGNHGRFEEVLEKIKSATEENNAWHENDRKMEA